MVVGAAIEHIDRGELALAPDVELHGAHAAGEIRLARQQVGGGHGRQREVPIQNLDIGARGVQAERQCLDQHRRGDLGLALHHEALRFPQRARAGHGAVEILLLLAEHPHRGDHVDEAVLLQIFQILRQFLHAPADRFGNGAADPLRHHDRGLATDVGRLGLEEHRRSPQERAAELQPVFLRTAEPADQPIDLERVDIAVGRERLRRQARGVARPQTQSIAVMTHDRLGADDLIAQIPVRVIGRRIARRLTVEHAPQHIEQDAGRTGRGCEPGL